MPASPTPLGESRQHPRLRLPAAYTLVRVRKEGDTRYPWTGHIYDISYAGMRLELDSALDPGTEIEIRALLPGSDHTTLHAKGRIVRLHDDYGEWGPRRMGMAFDYVEEHERRDLESYLDKSLRKAA